MDENMNTSPPDVSNMKEPDDVPRDSDVNRQVPENDPQRMQVGGVDMNAAPRDDAGVNRMSMDDAGKIRAGGGGAGTAALASGTRTFIVLGWISAVLTAFISPFFAIAGIVFGVLANRQARSSGNAVIATNIVLAAINVIFGLFFITTVRRMIFGF